VKYDSWASLSTRTFASPCFGREPKVRVATQKVASQRSKVFFFFTNSSVYNNMVKNMVVQLHKPTWENVEYVVQTNDFFCQG
jgi:hypothetical protein